MNIAKPQTHEEKLRACGFYGSEIPPKPAQLAEEHAVFADMPINELEETFPETAQALRAKGLEWAARLDVLTRDYWKEWLEKHGDAPPGVREEVAALTAQTLNSRAAEFFKDGDWDVEKAKAEHRKITDFVCAQHGWKPRQSIEEVIEERNSRNPARPSSVYTRLSQGGKQ